MKVSPERRSRFEANAFEAVIATVCLIVAMQFFLAPQSLEAQRTAQILQGNVLWAWNVDLGISAIAILSGLWTARGNWEAAGLFLLCGALVVQIVAVLFAVGVAALVGLSLSVGIVVACLARVAMIVRGGKR